MDKFGSHTAEDFAAALQIFVAGCQSVSDDYMSRLFPTLSKPTIEVQLLQKRARLVRSGGAHCFVDYATGDVLKTDGWSRPAKHARGNIYKADHGVGCMGPYGAAYMR